MKQIYQWPVLLMVVLVALPGPMVQGMNSAAGGSTPSTWPPEVLGRRHCLRVGPLPELVPADWCGCTWGAVFYGGRPVAGAQVTIDFCGQSIQAETFADELECYPYYAMDAWEIDLSRLEIFTVTVTYAGLTASRVVRALPDELGEQQVNLTLPAAAETWLPYSESPVRTLALDGDSVWTGSELGAVEYVQPLGCATPHTSLGLPTADVRDAAAIGGRLWLATSSGVAAFDGTAWTSHDPGLASSNYQALAIDPAAEDVYVAANETANGGVSRYDGSWHPLPDVNGSRYNTFRALLVDSSGRLWVGAENGLSRCDSNGLNCTTYTTDSGLGSNYVTALAESPDGDVWAATWSYVTSEGTKGGVSRYDAGSGTWQVYTPAEGLAGWDVADVAVDDLGRVWLAVWGGGVSLLDERAAGSPWVTYTTAHGLPSTETYTIAVRATDATWVGTSAGLYRLSDLALHPFPLASIDSVSPELAYRGETITFNGSAGGGDYTVGYEWSSNPDGLLGSTPSFKLEARALTPGTHLISFRAQDDEGIWSFPDTLPLVVMPTWRTYLPAVLR